MRLTLKCDTQEVQYIQYKIRDKMSTQNSRLDEAQGRNEQCTELYLTYCEGAAEFLTPRFAKSSGGAASFACRQADAAGGLG
jgi:hypothetical protein